MITKILMPFTELDKPILSASLLGGLFWLIGNCWALGPDSFGYLSVMDIIRASIISVPLAAILNAIMVLPVFIFSPPIKKARKYHYTSINIKISRFYFKNSTKIKYFLFCVLFSNFGVIFSLYMTENPKEKYIINQYTSIPLILIIIIIFFFLCSASGKNRFKIENILILLINILLIITTSSYSLSIDKILNKKYNYNENICVSNECWNGRTISRLSDATYFMQENTGRMIVVMNSQIISIKYFR
ncbi:hypothetical protein [Allorhizobium terrae]|uniref:Uncharacterized protein n=1 Tax=Allorhizobium terrae TaxID=1848972 RepID=A0A4S4A6Q0_9HYPH|nr:hypothetical protein [Allorhizobium terrae]THF54215.1 hypothetical protein E6C51_03765 [Allorhizobium terrae]